MPPAPLWEAEIDWSKRSEVAELNVKSSKAPPLQKQLPIDSRKAAIQQALETLWSGPTKAIAGPQQIDVVSHRVVHGGREYVEATAITPKVKAAIERLSVFAPLHNRADLDAIQVIEEILGPVPQIAVFDTAFHAQLPLAAKVYPGPYDWFEQGICRYGFHGISHEYCAQRAAQILGREPEPLRLITCHLGNGCSLAAVRNGRSVDTTMGFTPLEGLMMGTRCGSLDPGILLYLLRQGRHSADTLERILNRESGLLGISGVSADMRDVLASGAAGNERARLAFDLFVYRVRSYIGAMLASLGGLDALVFTAGIGENSAEVRAAACEPFGFLGLRLNPQKNTRSPVDQDIAAADSRVPVLVIHTQEDWAIAREAWKFSQAKRKPALLRT